MPKRNPPRKRVWHGPTALGLQRLFGRSPWALFASRIQSLRVDHEITGPPFDPFRFAQALGVSVEFCDGLTLDGKLTKTREGQLLVRLRRNQHPARMRFTLAHELAHAFFYEDLASLDQKEGHSKALVSYDDEEERLCDRAAAEMLMPR